VRRRPRLDAALADGADPEAEPALALRARQLTEPRARRAMASALRSILEAAEEPPDARSLGGPRPPLQREAILADRAHLLALAARLREPVPPQAAAMASLLVWDSASPLYAAEVRATLEQWTATILDAVSRAGGSARPRTS
jgi:hypothetical protein